MTQGAKCRRKSEPLKRESTNNHTIFIQTLNSFATFLVLFVFASLLHVWVHFSFIVYIAPCSKCFFSHIAYLTLLVTFALVLCLLHPVCLSFILALYLSKTFPWSYHHLLGFCSVLKLLYLDFVFVHYYFSVQLCFPSISQFQLYR